MTTLSDYEHMRPKAGEPEVVLRDVEIDGRMTSVCLLPHGRETRFLGTFGSDDVLPPIVYGE